MGHLQTFGERYKEHLKEPSPIHQHSNQTGHPTSHNNFQIIGREGHNLARNIKESIFIRVNNPTLNNNIGKFYLPYIWYRVVLNTPGLNLKGRSIIIPLNLINLIYLLVFFPFPNFPFPLGFSLFTPPSRF